MLAISHALSARLPALQVQGLERLADVALHMGQVPRAIQLCRQAFQVQESHQIEGLRTQGLLRVQAQAHRLAGQWQEATEALGRLLALRRDRPAQHKQRTELTRLVLQATDAELMQDAPTPLAQAAPTHATPRLTSAQLELLRHMTQGLTNRELGAQLGKSPNTVRNQIAALMKRLGVSTRTAAVSLALAQRIVEASPVTSRLRG